MTTWDETPEGGWPYRLRAVEKAVDAFQVWRGNVDTTLARRGEQYKNMEEKVDGLVQAVDSLRRVMLGFALSVAGSAIVFALSVLIATNKL